jgi:hypothetical protein
MWTPVSFNDLYDMIIHAEYRLTGEPLNFWKLIKILPEKWQEPQYGKEGGGFWVVAICGYNVIWYNDIEDGFNISRYNKYGTISEYQCCQVLLDDAVIGLLGQLKFDTYDIV